MSVVLDIEMPESCLVCPFFHTIDDDIKKLSADKGYIILSYRCIATGKLKRNSTEHGLIDEFYMRAKDCPIRGEITC